MKQKSLQSAILILATINVLLCGYYWSKSSQEHASTNKVLNTRSLNSVKITIDDVHITVKTTKRFLTSRVLPLRQTWVKAVKNQVYFVTDEGTGELKKELGDHIITTDCSRTHQLPDLCCKTATEFQTFIKSKAKWWCHFDDDVYVRPEKLVVALNDYRSSDYIYIGRQSRPEGKMIMHNNRETIYHYLTGAAYCISRPLAELMKPYMGVNDFVEKCVKLDETDDCLVGFIITQLLGVSYIDSPYFHSDYLPFRLRLKNENMSMQVTLSNSHYFLTKYFNKKKHTPIFKPTDDSTMFLSLHCFLYPSDEICPVQ